MAAELAPAANTPASLPSHKHGLTQTHVWGGTVITISLVFLVAWLYFCFKRKLYANCNLCPRQKGKLDARKLLLRRFQYEELRKATDNFSEDCLVGTGAFGNVYRGQFDIEGVLAIKKLHPTSCTSIEEFRNEVRLISKVKHQNLVRLVGFCEQAGSKGTKALVYEYVSNGSLLDYIMGRGGMCLLWRQRVNIAIGAAKGIAHLHEGLKPSIIHRDIKPSNILIGENFEANVSDFGLVKAGPQGDHSHVSSLVKGTPGYLDPAYCASFHLSPFTDVFSFGVILLQLVAARPAVDSRRGHPNAHIIEWARPSLERGRVEEILDANLMVDKEVCNMEMMLKMGQIGLRCVVGKPKQRPTMTQVWQELEVALRSADTFLPRQPFLNSQKLKESFGETNHTSHFASYRTHSQSSISVENIGLQKFYIDTDNLSFRSASLRCLETDSVSIDVAADNGIEGEASTGTDENISVRSMNIVVNLRP